MGVISYSVRLIAKRSFQLYVAKKFIIKRLLDFSLTFFAFKLIFLNMRAYARNMWIFDFGGPKIFIKRRDEMTKNEDD